MNDLLLGSASRMAHLVRSKKVSPVELLEAHYRRIEQLNPRLHAFVQLDRDHARRAAQQAEAAVLRGDATGALHGVPLSIKSSISVSGMRWEAGTRLREGMVGASDAPLVRRLRDAGAVVLGTTNTPELLMAWETDNLLYGRTNNPWDLARTAGGSSGGEAAAIAAGCSAGGVGSDGGGSIRVPAHFSGICGLKPTPGRIPATAHYPESLGPFALIGVVGPMARTVEDLKLLFSAMQGPDDGDPSSAPVTLHWPSAEALKKTRIAVFEDDGRTPVTAETRKAVRDAAAALGGAGFDVRGLRPQGLEAARQLWWKYFGVAGGMLLGPLTAGHESQLSPILREFNRWVGAEEPHSGQSLLDAWVQRDVVRRQVLERMSEHPILLCPVAAIPAFRHGERQWQVDGQPVSYLDAWSYTEWFNLLGFPAAVVPFGRSAENLPIGVQIVGRPWQEELVLEIAARLEQQRGPWASPAIE
jgi:Asp-tRNA(Asn)/Glu-tRNA(Gln) amidotransferase A subunit family amidase